MTRRDYCVECGEMVGDCDVICEICSDSMCHCCATTYGPVSRICVLDARFNVLCEPTITKNELCQYYQDINDQGFINVALTAAHYNPVGGSVCDTLEEIRTNIYKTKQLLDLLGLPLNVINVIDGEYNIPDVHINQFDTLLKKMAIKLFICQTCYHLDCNENNVLNGDFVDIQNAKLVKENEILQQQVTVISKELCTLTKAHTNLTIVMNSQHVEIELLKAQNLKLEQQVYILIQELECERDAHEITEETNIRLERNITMLRTRRDCC